MQSQENHQKASDHYDMSPTYEQKQLPSIVTQVVSPTIGQGQAHLIILSIPPNPQNGGSALFMSVMYLCFRFFFSSLLLPSGGGERGFRSKDVGSRECCCCWCVGELRGVTAASVCLRSKSTSGLHGGDKHDSFNPFNTFILTNFPTDKFSRTSSARKLEIFL